MHLLWPSKDIMNILAKVHQQNYLKMIIKIPSQQNWKHKGPLVAIWQNTLWIQTEPSVPAEKNKIGFCWQRNISKILNENNKCRAVHLIDLFCTISYTNISVYLLFFLLTEKKLIAVTFRIWTNGIHSFKKSHWVLSGL